MMQKKVKVIKLCDLNVRIRRCIYVNVLCEGFTAVKAAKQEPTSVVLLHPDEKRRRKNSCFQKGHII